MRELTTRERLALHTGQAVLLENACQQVVNAVSGVTGYRIIEPDAESAGRIEFSAGRWAASVPFAGALPSVVQRETVEGMIAQVRAGLAARNG